MKRKSSMREVFVKTCDSTAIAFNHYETGHDSVLVICPGWFMTKDSGAFCAMAQDFSKFYDVVVMDFRGHGRSSGFYTFTSKEEFDIDAVVRFLANKYRNIYLAGFSLGGALALLYSAKNTNIDKIIAVSAPSDFYKIENRMYLPDAWYPTLFQKFEPKRWLTIRPGNLFLHKDKPIDFVKDISVPILFLAGENDPTVFAWHTKALCDAARCDKSYVLFKKARHAEDLYIDFRQNFMDICLSWLDR